MEQLVLSLSVPSLRTIFNKAIYWASVCCRCREVEISNHRRGTTRVTLEVNRARTPAADVRRHARLREGHQPATVSVLWTNHNNITTNVAVWIEDI